MTVYVNYSSYMQHSTLARVSVYYYCDTSKLVSELRLHTINIDLDLHYPPPLKCTYIHT